MDSGSEPLPQQLRKRHQNTVAALLSESEPIDESDQAIVVNSISRDQASQYCNPRDAAAAYEGVTDGHLLELEEATRSYESS